jgi:hypothetical protein
MFKCSSILYHMDTILDTCNTVNTNKVVIRIITSDTNMYMCSRLYPILSTEGFLQVLFNIYNATFGIWGDKM